MPMPVPAGQARHWTATAPAKECCCVNDKSQSGGNASDLPDIPDLAGTPDLLNTLVRSQTEAVTQFLGQILPGVGSELPDPSEAAHWLDVGKRLQTMLIDFQAEQASRVSSPPHHYTDTRKWMETVESW